MEYPIGSNVVAKIEGDILTLTIDLSKSNGLSGSQKSTSIATTGGNVPLAGVDRVIKVGVNVYSPR